ncbi:unnamed protein product [Pleuronectes platessa]|uniref:Uncharacterized protein n=1 Tax=Pleuronectes platessa TaxID=8262 RepID=A0A9N7YVJ7_PLEPL|nr:unnamed protein product [Pleuronectes platessa]
MPDYTEANLTVLARCTFQSDAEVKQAKPRSGSDIENVCVRVCACECVRIQQASTGGQAPPPPSSPPLLPISSHATITITPPPSPTSLPPLLPSPGAPLASRGPSDALGPGGGRWLGDHYCPGAKANDLPL